MLSDQPYRKLLLFVVCLLGIISQTSCTSKSNHFGVIFTSNSPGPIDIYRIPDNTQSKVEQLTFTPTIGEYHLLVSKNGDKIVFEAGPTALQEDTAELGIESPRHIYILDTTSKKLVDITNILDKYPQVGPEFFMDWSPDQKQFVVITYDGGGYEIKSFLKLVGFDGKNKKDILIPMTDEIPSLINGVKWSPNGKKFVLTRGIIGIEQQLQNPGAAILVYDLENGNLTQIADHKDQCLPQEWSPTSQQIVATCSYVPPYSEGISGPETIRIFDVENPGQPDERLALSPCYNPSWSPTGRQIVFVCDKGTNEAGLFVINSDGSNIHEINLGDLGNPAILKDPTWSPTGAQIVYVAGSNSEHTNIYSVSPAGSNNHSLTNEEAFYSIVSVYPLP